MSDPKGRTEETVVTVPESKSSAYQDGFKAGQEWAADNSRSMGERLLDDDEYAAGCAAGAGQWLAMHGPSSGILQGGHRRPEKSKSENSDEQAV